MKWSLTTTPSISFLSTRLQGTVGMFDEIVSWGNVTYAYKQTQKGSPKHKIPAIRFRKNETSNLKDIRDAVKNGKFKPKGFYLFEIEEPKRRIIHAPAYEDKIVHHMLYQKLRDFYEPKFISDSYSCIRGKGNQRAVKKLQHFMRKVEKRYGEVWLYKLDVSKFFPSIVHDILKKILSASGIDSKTLNLCYTIIDSSPHELVGLPLGCVTSQLFANVYMNPLDHFMKRCVKVKNYLRYADDIFILCESKEKAVEYGEKCHKYLRERLNLSCAENKRYIKKVSQAGLDGLGYKIFSTHILLTSKAKIRAKRMVNGLLRDYSSGRKTKRQVNCSLAAWSSHANLASSFGFIRKLLKDFPDLSYENKILKLTKRGTRHDRT